MIDRCILLIEEDDEARALMVPALRAAYPQTTITVCSRVEYAWAWIRRHYVRCYFICSGTDELGFLERISPFGRIILHSREPQQNTDVIEKLSQSGWNTARCTHLHRGNGVHGLVANWGMFLHSACGEPGQLDELWAPTP